MKKTISIFTNKYLLAGTFVIIWMLFFDDRDIFTRIQNHKELSNLESKANYYKQEISKAQKELNDLNSNAFAIEKLAREQFKMKRNSEVLFLVEEEQLLKK